MSFSKNIIGKGFIAKNLLKINSTINQNGMIVYAAGISNSQTKSKKQFVKEIKLFKNFTKKNYKNKIMYISTADVSNNLKNRTKYVKNKIKIEKIIKKNFNNFIILRIPQLIGKSSNKNTLINFFYNKIKEKKKIIVFKNVKRNILDIDDVIKMIQVIIMNKKVNKKIITLSNKNFIKPIEIIKILEKKLKKKANYILIKTKKQNWKLNFNQNIVYFRNAKINFSKDYLVKAVKKYY